MSTPSREATAYHEAGHAVIALHLGRPVQRVSILAKEQTLGRCEFRKGQQRPTEDWLEREILISLAGLAAEARFTGEYAWEGALRDLQGIRQLALQRAGERQADRFIKRMLSKVEHLLSQPGMWRVVERIVAELLRCESLSGRAAVHLYEQGIADADDLH
ncbi:MAG: cell division protein FtsH [Planctomycetota bacterium]|nr:MAG: cell division protein FtsH [Planctomycetota bacterium]